MGPLSFGLGVALGFVGSIPAAGPLLFLVIASGLEGRQRRALALACGGALAESVYVALAFWGFAGLLDHYGGLAHALRLSGAVLLFVLGVALVRRKASRAPAESGAARSFATGFVLVGSNPAFLATWSAVAAVLYSNGFLSTDPRRVPWLAAGSFVGVVLWFAGVAALASRHRERFDPRVLDRVVRALGGILILLAAWMLLSALTSSR